MKIILLSNTHKFPFHFQITKALNTIISSNGFNAQIIDVIDKTSLLDLSSQLSAISPDLIITLDLAGFELRTVTGECLLNMLPCKVCNIIWSDRQEYQKYLTGKLSLAMLFYDATGIDNELPAKYPYMRYYYPTAKKIDTTPSRSSVNETETLEVLQNIWAHFTQEVLL